MIKCETLGMIQIAKNNPVLTSETDTAIYDFITQDGITYLVANTLSGDEVYQDDIVIKAGDPISGFEILPWEGMRLIIDEKHIAYGDGESYDDIVAGTTLMEINDDGKVEIVATAPNDGIYFKVVEKCRLTENAVKVLIVIADDAIVGG